MKKYLSLLLSLTMIGQSALGWTITDNTLTFGNGASDKTFIYNKGSGSSNPKQRWNNSTSKFQYSLDGSTWKTFNLGTDIDSTGGTSGQYATANGSGGTTWTTPVSSIPSYTFTYSSPTSVENATGEYVFNFNSANVTSGATYTNNSKTFTCNQTISSGKYIKCTGTGAPTSTGTLTKASGTGDSTITFLNVSYVGTYYPDYVFLVSGANVTSGATYTNNGATFTCRNTIASGTYLYCWTASGSPTSSGTLTKASGTGDSTISFSFSKISAYRIVDFVGAGSGASGNGTSGSITSGGIGGVTMLGSSFAIGGGATGSDPNTNNQKCLKYSNIPSASDDVIADYKTACGGAAQGCGGGCGGGFGGMNPFCFQGEFANYATVPNKNVRGCGGGGQGDSGNTSFFSGFGGNSGGYLKLKSFAASLSYSIGVGGIGSSGDRGTGGDGGDGYMRFEEFF